MANKKASELRCEAEHLLFLRNENINLSNSNNSIHNNIIQNKYLENQNFTLEHDKNIPFLPTANMINIQDSSSLREGYESDKLSDSDEEQDVDQIDKESSIQIVYDFHNSVNNSVDDNNNSNDNNKNNNNSNNNNNNNNGDNNNDIISNNNTRNNDSNARDSDIIISNGSENNNDNNDNYNKSNDNEYKPM